MEQTAPSSSRYLSMLTRSGMIKIEKVPRGIQGEKTRQVWGNWAQQLEHKQVPKQGDGTRCSEGKPSQLSCHTLRKCSVETTRNSVRVNLGIRVVKLVESLVGWEVTGTGQGSE